MTLLNVWLAVSLFPAILYGVSVGQLPPNYQRTTCSVLQQLAVTSTCQVSSSCCSRVKCGVFIDTYVQFQVLPCTSPPSINFQFLQGRTVLYDRTFQHSEDISISPLFPTIHLELVQADNYSSVTFSLSVGSTTIVPSTSIPIDRSQCDPHHPSDACPMVPTSASSVPTSSTLSTCQSLRNIAGSAGTCMVDDDCSFLHCTFLNQYPADLVIEPCLDPPSVTVLVRQSEEGVVLVNETLTKSRTQPVTIGDQVVFDLTVIIEHRDNPDIIVLTVLASPTALPTNFTLIPRTVIPLDRSNCSNNITGVHTADIPLPPTSATTEGATCRTLKQLSQTITGTCHTDHKCDSVLCDLNLLTFSYVSNLTVLPCLDVPGVRLLIINSENHSVVLNRTLTKSGLENITVGGSNVTLNETVIQAPDQSSITIQVDLLLPIPLPSVRSVPILPRTRIPIDRCDCPNINCATSPPPIQTVFNPTDKGTKPTGAPSTKWTKTTGTSKSSGSAQTGSIKVTQTGSIKVTQSTVESTPKSSSGAAQIVIPVAVVAGVLLVVVVVVVAAALAYFIYIKRKNKAYGFQRMSFEEVKEEN